MKKELRYMRSGPEVRSSGEEQTVSGLGIVYDSWTELFPGFKEKINQGAAKREKEVKSFVNHNPDNVLSTTESNPPLELEEEEGGVRYTSPVPPTSYGENLKINLERGNVKGSSFAFYIPEGGDRLWEDEDGVIHREIDKLYYREIGPVTDPAYIDTSASVRTAEGIAEEYRKAKENQEKEKERREAFFKFRERQLELKKKECERYES